MRQAFTLIEILVSVFLISIVIVGILNIRQRHIDMAHYLSERSKEELLNTLFLKKEFQKYNRDEKDAYTLIHSLGFPIDDLNLRKILRDDKKLIRVSDPLPIGDLPFPVEIKRIGITGKTSSTYYRIFY